MRQTWDPPRVTTVLEELIRNGATVQKMTKWSGLNRSTIYRWKSGAEGGKPDYDTVGRLAEPLWRRGYIGLARELVEAFGYPWVEPKPDREPPGPVEVMTDAWGADIAERVARQVREHAGDDADAVLQGIADDLRRPASEGESGPDRAAG